MNKDIKNWIDSSSYDMETAQHLLKTGRYLYVIFMCHLALEKALKANLAAVGHPPLRTHDLILLVRKADITDMPMVHLDFLGLLNNASLPVRYPDDLEQAVKDYPEPIAREYLDQAGKVFLWLKNRLK